MGYKQKDTPEALAIMVVTGLVSLVAEPLLRTWALHWVDTTFGVAGLSWLQWFGLAALWGVLTAHRNVMTSPDEKPASWWTAKLLGTLFVYPLGVAILWLWAHVLGVL